MSLIGKMKANSAFTLIEIMLVVIIVGIILAISAPNFSKGYSRFQINKTADDLLDVSRWAQAMAIGQQRIYALSFSQNRRYYNLVFVKDPLQNEAAGSIDETNDHVSFEPVKGNLGRMHKIPDAIHLVMTQPYGSRGTGDIDHIEFFPDGTLGSATIQLNSSDQKAELSTTAVRGMMTKVDSE